MEWTEDILPAVEELSAKLGPNTRLIPLRRFDVGYTEAEVYVVDVLSLSGFSGMAVLKIQLALSTAGKLTDEAGRHRTAVKDSPERFTSEHLPHVIASHELEAGWGLLTSIAGGSLHVVFPAFQLSDQQLTQAYGCISRGLLDDWNPDYTVSETAVPVWDAVKEWLDHSRLNRVLELGETALGMDQEKEAFSLEGMWLPNPMWFVTQDGAQLTESSTLLFFGRGHGDLHGYNVLVRVDNPEHYSYFLIDLSHYRSLVPLFFDHAYLELSFLLARRKGSSVKRWLQILQAITGRDAMATSTESVELDDYGVVSVVEELRKGLASWACSAEENREDPIHLQALLARVATGLNFAGKRLPFEQKAYAMIYAAANLKALLARLGTDWSKRGSSVQLHPKPVPAADNWHQVYRACDGFDPNRGHYILVAGPGLRNVQPELLSTLGQLPFSLILDFDQDSCTGGLVEATQPALLKRRDFVLMRLDTIRDINPERATAVFLANGSTDDPESCCDSFDDWRRQFVPSIREKLARRVRNDTAPEPLTIIIIPTELDSERLRACWEALDEEFGERAKYIVLRKPDLPHSILSGRGRVQEFRIGAAGFLAGLAEVLGEVAQPGETRLPCRAADRKEWITLTPKDARYLEQDLEVVHAGLASRADDERSVARDFWRGMEISWLELDVGGVDIPRDVEVEGGAQVRPLEDVILHELRNPGLSVLTMQHTPGAGGTTVARRLAWEVKDRYPTALLTRVSASTEERIHHLFHETGLPVFVIAEAGVCTSAALGNLHKQLARRKVSGVFLHVVRSLNPSSEISLADPMSLKEAERFLKKYERIAVPDRQSSLRRLARKREMEQYRSPFFFGLFAFERDFVHVPEFVSSNLGDVSGEAREIVLYLALATRFSQAGLAKEEVRQLLGLRSGAPLRVAEKLGDGPSRLILARDRTLRLIHPMIAEEVLRQLLGRQPSGGEWPQGLEHLCRSFISGLAKLYARDPEASPAILEQMFIVRESWWGEIVDETEGKKTFAELIHMIPGETSQNRVLRCLAESFPNNAHFWNHLGRHYMYAMGPDFENAESCLEKAIKLDERNPIHHHTLGMVYRLEAKRRLRRLRILRKGIDAAKGEGVLELVDYAEDAFLENRKLDRESEYGYISHMQVITETIEGLFHLSPHREMTDFWRDSSTTVDWCREKLGEAENILMSVKSLQIHRRLSHRTLYCQSLIDRAYGRYDATIETLNALLQRTDVRHQWVRRMLASAHVSSKQHRWTKLSSSELHRIRSLMEQNLDDDPTNPYDLQTWLAAARRLDDFDSLEAINRLETWARKEESLEAEFYLYVLHFTRWIEELSDDDKIVKEHIDRTFRLAGSYGRTYPREWLTLEPASCPLREAREMGTIRGGKLSGKQASGLRPREGRVTDIIGPQAGFLRMGSFRVFFFPGDDFLKGRDEETWVNVYLGFSYEGLRAYNPTRIGDFRGTK